MKKTMPEIVALGVYDGELVHKNRAQTPSRRVHLYEIELVLEDGGTTYVDGRGSPIRAHNVIIQMSVFTSGGRGQRAWRPAGCSAGRLYADSPDGG